MLLSFFILKYFLCELLYLVIGMNFQNALQLWGSGGAAEVLNIPPSTFKSKMKKLDIKKDNNE